MAEDRTVQLQHCLDRIRAGDDSARRELIERAYERLRFLAKRILHQDFPRLQVMHETESVVHEAVRGLLTALQEVHPSTVRDFFTLAAQRMRWVLLDFARQVGNRPQGVNFSGQSSNGNREGVLPREPADSSDDPARLAVWTEFHERVERLPPEEREVVDLYWYQGLSQSETAAILGVHEKLVSRRWLRARLKLAGWVPRDHDLLQERGETHA